MTNELKKKLYCLFGVLLVLVWIISQFTIVVMGINLSFVKLICYVIAIIVAIICIKKYRLLRALKAGAIVAIGFIAVIGLFAFSVINFYLTTSLIAPIFDLSSGFLLIIPKNIALYLGVVGLWGTYKIKVNNTHNNTANSATAPQNETQTNRTFCINENLRQAIYQKYCEEVKKSLKSPASAVFCSIDELSITDNYGVYSVNGWVDSQNSYGAMIRSNVKLQIAIENGQLISKTNLAMHHGKVLAGTMVGYYIIGAIITAILFGISYFFISGMF